MVGGVRATLNGDLFSHLPGGMVGVEGGRGSCWVMRGRGPPALGFSWGAGPCGGRRQMWLHRTLGALRGWRMFNPFSVHGVPAWCWERRGQQELLPGPCSQGARQGGQCMQ